MENNKTVRGAMAATSSYTNPFRYRRQSTAYDTVRLFLYGTWTGTVTLQISDPDQGSWIDEDVWTTNGSAIYTPGGDCDLRWFFTSRTSGTAIGSIVSNA